MTVLDKICGAANQKVFVGFTDLFQKIVQEFCPDIWPFTIVEDVFNKTFDALQKQMEPLAYQVGAAMGLQIENQASALVKAKFDIAMAELNKAKNQALNEIAEAEKILTEHTAKIQNLAERLTQLEGQRKSFWPPF